MWRINGEERKQMYAFFNCFFQQFPAKTKSDNGVPIRTERFFCNFLVAELLFYRIGYLNESLLTLHESSRVIYKILEISKERKAERF